MAYLDDKIEQTELQGSAPKDNVPRARLDQLAAKWKGPNLKEAVLMRPRKMKIYDMENNEEIWELDGDQEGTMWKHKMYKRTK